MLSTMDIAVGFFAYIGALSLTRSPAHYWRCSWRSVPGPCRVSTLLAVFLLGVALWSIAQSCPPLSARPPGRYRPR